MNTHVRRSKLRRFFETEMRETNRKLREKCLGDYDEYIFIRFSSHMIDRLIDRNISEYYTMEIFNKMIDRIPDIMDFINLKDRPMRLEITDGNLWTGMTVDVIERGVGCIGLCVRMVIENPKRLSGKMPAFVIHV